MDVTAFPDPALMRGAVAVDCETYDPLINASGAGWPQAARSGDGAGFVSGVAVAWRDGAYRAGYHGFRDPDGRHVEGALHARRWLADLHANPAVVVVCHNAPYDLGWLLVEGIPWPRRHRDTRIVGALLDEHRASYALSALAADWVGPTAAKQETEIVAYAAARGWHPKRDLWRMPTALVARYARHDAWLTLALAHAMEPRRLAEIPAPLLRLEHDLQRVLVAMRMRGVRIDVDHMEQARVLMLGEAAQLRREVLKGARPSAARDLEPLLVAEGHHPQRTTTGLPRIDKAWLQSLESPLASAILRVRWLEKQANTFLTGVLSKTLDGRLHGELHALMSDEGGTVSGRLSSSKPNLQNLTAKADPLRIVRRGFLPEPGTQWVALDYAGQEARIAVHAANDPVLLDAYRRDPHLDLYAHLQQSINRSQPSINITRDQSKVIFLATLYGAGMKKLADMLHVADATDIRNAFHAGAPWVSRLKNRLEQHARVDGYIETVYRRRARFHPVRTPHDTNTPLTAKQQRRYSFHVTLNRHVQGSGADQIKLALVALYAAGITPITTVHDEIDVSLSAPEEMRQCAEIMRDVLPLRVPMVVDVAAGPTWGAAADLFRV